MGLKTDSTNYAQGKDSLKINVEQFNSLKAKNDSLRGVFEEYRRKFHEADLKMSQTKKDELLEYRKKHQEEFIDSLSKSKNSKNKKVINDSIYLKQLYEFYVEQDKNTLFRD